MFQVTIRNTELMNEVATLTETQLNTTRELNFSDKNAPTGTNLQSKFNIVILN